MNEYYIKKYDLEIEGEGDNMRVFKKVFGERLELELDDKKEGWLGSWSNGTESFSIWIPNLKK